jgi:hypothetical protein
MSYAIGFIAGFLLYHLLMNRAVMMRECCLKHFASHAECECPHCHAERVLR